MNCKILISMVTFFIVLFFIPLGCSNNEEKLPPEKEEVVEETQKETITSSVEMNDEIYVDIKAHQIYLPDKYTKKYGKKVHTDPETAEKFLADFNREMESLYKKYGVTEKSVEDYGVKCSDDIAHFTILMERVNKHAKELKEADK